jgi:23S rRNA pseudouridine1911/1915/1917 synthase
MAAGDDEAIQLTVPEGVRPERADKLLARLHPGLSRSRWQKLFLDGRVWRDDEVLAPKNKLRAGEVVEFSLPPVRPLELRPVAMDLAVLHEDADILVIDKEPGRVVHPGAGTGDDTLVHGILHHCKGRLSGIGGVERPGIVHRLDKETSGLLVVAKSDTAFQSLADQFSSRTVIKYYTALLRGVPAVPQGTIEESIGRHPVHRTRMSCRKDGRSAKTDYTIQRRWGGAASLALLRIHTGRTHQIRVHMKHLGHPLLGDTLYGYRARIHAGGREIELPPAPRVMLHATVLEFSHPATGKAMRFEAGLPVDFSRVMDELDSRFQPGESH